MRLLCPQRQRGERMWLGDGWAAAGMEGPAALGGFDLAQWKLACIHQISLSSHFGRSTQ